jgi:hypothetical protein
MESGSEGSAGNLEEAIACYQDVLEVRTRDAMPGEIGHDGLPRMDVTRGINTIFLESAIPLGRERYFEGHGF